MFKGVIKCMTVTPNCINYQLYFNFKKWNEVVFPPF